MKAIKEFISMCKYGSIPITQSVYSTGDGVLRFTNLDTYVSYKTNTSFPEFMMDLKQFKNIISVNTYTIAEIVDKYKHFMINETPPVFPKRTQEFICHMYDIKYVKQLAKIASNDPLRQAINCIYIYNGNAVATDANILVVCKHCIKEHNGDKVLIDKKHISLLQASYYDVYETDSKEFVCLVNPERNIEFIVRNDQNTFPIYESILPADTPYSYDFVVSDLIKTIETVTAGLKNPKIKIDFNNNIITGFDSELTVKIDNYANLSPKVKSNDKVIIYFSADVILKALKMCTHKLSTIHAQKSDSLIKIGNNIIVAPIKSFNL